MNAKSAKIKEEKMSKYKKTAPLFLFHEGQRSICLFSVSCYSFVETIFRMKLNTLVTKYMDTFTFNFANTINPINGAHCHIISFHFDMV